MPSRYSLWLDEYKKNKGIILGNLKKCKREIKGVGEIISREEDLFLPIPDFPSLPKRSCFVDGGEGIEELLGGAIYFIRASGLLWGEKTKQKFLRNLALGILKYDDYTKERVEFLRAGLEIDIALKCLEEYSPQYLFLDGSLQVNSNPKKIPGQEYDVYRKKFARLLRAAKSQGVFLCGISEDSHSRLFLRHLSRKHQITFPPFLTDCSFLKMLAGNKKFVTPTFLPDSPLASTNFSTFYLQPTPLSTPLRIDIPPWGQDNLSETVSFVTKLSQGSKNYGYPLPLYLVHLDAKIEKKQAYWSTRQIVHHIFKDNPKLYDAVLRERRRDIRPGEKNGKR